MQQQTVYGLCYDYTLRGGHTLVFSRTQPLTSDQLSPLQVRMLQDNRIPNLLPFEKFELNDEVKLMYRFTGQRKLSDLLSMQSLTVHDFFHIMDQLVNVLIESTTYMLDAENYIIHEDFIFGELPFNELSLCYLPLTSLTNKNEVRHDLEKLAIHLISYVEYMSHPHEAWALIQMIRDPDVPLIEIQVQIKQFKAIDTFDRFRAMDPLDRFRVMGPKEVESSQMNEIDILDGADSPAVAIYREEIVSKPKKSGILPSSEWGSKRVIYLTAAVLICCIAILYMNFSYEGMMYICMGVAGLIGNGAYLWGKILQSRAGEAHDPETDVNFSVDEHASLQFEDTSEEYYDHLPQMTSVLAAPDMTVVLNDAHPHLFQKDEKQEVNEQHHDKAYLLIEEGEQRIRIPLTTPSFVIGRDNPACCDFIDPLGVSRLHCSIQQADDGWRIQDLASSNGTKVNGQSLVPYKWHQLNDGDEINCVSNSFIFKVT